MSYQFEDESALEELLNRQLDRSRVKSSQYQALTTSTRGKSASSANESAAPRSTNLSSWLNKDTSRPNQTATGSVAAVSLPPETIQPSATSQQTQATSSLNQAVSVTDRLVPFADQLSLSSSVQPAAPRIISNVSAATTSLPGSERLDATAPVRVTSAKISEYVNTQKEFDFKLDEAQLQQMTKQRLIRLIVDELEPVLSKQQSSELEDTKKLITQLEEQVQAERDKIEMMQKEHENKLRLSESSWSQINKQLERRLEIAMNEVAMSVNSSKELVKNFEEEQRKQIELLAETYRARFEDQREQFGEELRRIKELHKLELSSKLRINGDLSTLESTYTNWDQTIKTTVQQLELQFSSVERLLDKQTSSIKGTNDTLESKTNLVHEQGVKFKENLENFHKLANSIRDQLATLSCRLEKSEELERLTSRMTQQFEEMTKLSQDLAIRQRIMLDEMEKINLKSSELNAESQRLGMEAKRLEMLSNSNEAKEMRLFEEQKEIQQQTLDLHGKKSSMDAKWAKIKSKFDKIQLVQRRQTMKEQELVKWQLELAEERKSVRREASSVEKKLNRLTSIRANAQKEMNQLQRVQKSLICSTCLDRLYREPQSTNYDKANL